MQGEKRQTSTQTCNETMLRAKLRVFVSRISPPLRTFAPSATAHPYSARKFPCHVMHRARVLSTKMNNDRAVMVIAALLGFNDLGCSVTPTFLFRNRFYLQLSLHCPKMKYQRGKLKKFQDFCPRDMKSCHLAAARRMKLWSLNANLFFKEPQQLTKIT